MNYKLVCIQELFKDNDIRVEICNGESNRISPFQTRLSTEDLIHSELIGSKKFILLLNNLGYINQPFRIPNVLTAIKSIDDLLQSNSFFFYITKKFDSLHRYTYQSHYNRQNPVNYTTGKIIRGELYIDNSISWFKNIQVRFLYEDAIIPLFPIYNDYPYKTQNNGYLMRNYQEEQKYLADLKPYYKDNTVSMTLNGFDIDFIKGLVSKKWKVFVTNSKKAKSELHLKTNKSGISWFSTDKKQNDNELTQILSAYLNNRNIAEFSGQIVIMKNDDFVNKQSNENFVEQFFSADCIKFFKKNVPNTESEIQSYKNLLKSLFKATLRPYQNKGVLWLKEMRKNNKGCLLADEMGLGKTVQILAHLATIKSPQAPFLIIAPTSLISNWENEIKKFIPFLADKISVQEYEKRTNSIINLVSYDIVRIHLDYFKSVKYDTIVMDEAQVLKNKDSKKHLAISKLSSNHRIIITGTPIENSINDIWSHFFILIPEFKGLFARIAKLNFNSSEQFVKMSSKLLNPFILRRVKKDVLTDLPERFEKTIRIEMSKKERSIYDKVQGVFIKAIETGISGRLNSIALEGLLRLRQTCVSPNLLPTSLNSSKEFISTKLELALNYIEQFKNEKNKVIVFSQFVGVLDMLKKYLTEREVGFVELTGSTINRLEPVNRFQTDKTITAFLISLKAGGVGLNLTAANKIIMLDDWWNPTVEEQAFARAHRIGQSKDVLVLRLIYKNTVEEKILQLQESKKQTIDIFNAVKYNSLTIEQVKNLIMK